MGLIADLERDGSKNGWSHAYLFICNDETETEAVIDQFVKKRGCLPADLVEINSSEDGKCEIKVSDTRRFLHDLSLSPFGTIKIGLIRHAELLNLSSANILLKTLEEPPKNVMLILTAQSPNILSTIKSRCRIYQANTLRKSLHTFSYDEFLTGSLATAFKKIEEIVKDNQVEVFLTETEQYFEEKMLSKQSQKYAEILTKTLNTRKNIKNNANSRLALENLILKARKI